MFFPHGRWLLCAPRFYDVTYEINPWMKVSQAPEQRRAASQWQQLHHTLIRLGAWVEYVEPRQGLPDMVFTANAGLIRGKKCVLSHFQFPQRQGEEKYFRDWFVAHGYEVRELQSGSFEGEGDALSVGDVLFAGSGFRSDAAAYEEIGKYLEFSKLINCQLIDPRFYHLDTCFCPLNESKALCFTPAFSAESMRAMSEQIEIISVPEADALKFACNAVVLGKDIVLPAGCAETEKKLHALGFSTHPVELDEFIKAGGAAKCLSLRL